MSPTIDIEEPTHSLTHWWSLLNDDLDLLEERYPLIAEKTYFQAARKMIALGQKTETLNPFFLLLNKTQLESAETKLGHRIIKQRDNDDSLTMTGYIPTLNSPLSCQFAIAFYEHLLRYKHVRAEGRYATLLQKGFSGNGSDECIEYHQPFTHSAAKQLKEQIQSYILNQQHTLFDFLNENEGAFKALCERVNINITQLDDFYYWAPEPASPLQSKTDTAILLRKIARYLNLSFHDSQEAEPVQLLMRLQQKVQSIKRYIDEFITLKKLLSSVESAKESQYRFNDFIKSNEAQSLILPRLTQEAKARLDTLSFPSEQHATSRPASPQSNSRSYQFFTALAPAFIKSSVDTAFGWQPASPRKRSALPQQEEQQHYDWLSNELTRSLSDKIHHFKTVLQTNNTIVFNDNDFKQHDTQELTTLSNHLSTCSESLSEVEKAIDQYIKKHRFGLAKFVDYKPIRAMTKVFAKIGFSLVINDKFFYFNKIRQLKKTLAHIKQALQLNEMTVKEAQDKIWDVSTELQVFAAERSHKSQYFKHIKSLRRDCQRAADDLSNVAIKTQEVIRGVNSFGP